MGGRKKIEQGKKKEVELYNSGFTDQIFNRKEMSTEDFLSILQDPGDKKVTW